MKSKGLVISFGLILVVMLAGCEQTQTEAEQLSEFQITACNSADKGNTCDTKLPELDLVTKEECCEILGKCC